MHTFTVKNPNPGSPAGVFHGIFTAERTRVSLGGIDKGPSGATHVPLSRKLQQELPEDRHIAAASVMRSATDLKFIAVENAMNDNAGAALVLINVEPAAGPGKTVDITGVELHTQKCPGRGWTNAEPKSCEHCGMEYVKETPDAQAFSHPQAGHVNYHRQHLSHHIKIVGEGSHIRDKEMTHRELLVIMEPGARVRIAMMEGTRTVSEQVLVRTHTELDFAQPGDIYLASELSEENAAYFK